MPAAKKLVHSQVFARGQESAQDFSQEKFLHAPRKLQVFLSVKAEQIE